MFVKRVSYLVYEYGGQCPAIARGTSDVSCAFLNAKLISHFFDADHQRKRTFTQFIKKGFVGLILYRGDEWITYAWMSTPFSMQPVHLPPWGSKLGAYWIFYCGTKEQHRNRGYYKLAMRFLIQYAFETGPNPTVYIDTDVSNIPSRRAILSVGFQPRGILECIKCGIPKVGYLTFGRWEKGVQHPELSETARLWEAL